MNPNKRLALSESNGFTLVELIVVMGLVALLFTISIMSLANIDREGQIDNITSSIKISLLRAQSQTVNGNPAGVYFENNRYIYFYGDTYLADNPTNEITDLPSYMSINNINLPSGTISYDKITGYVKDFIPPENLTLTDQETQKIKLININKLGIVEVE